MRFKQSHIIPLFFLLLTLAPTLVMSGLQLFQAAIRQRMEHALDKEALTTISLPAGEVVWYEEGREVMVEGRMFDIKTYEIKDGVFTAQGIYDEAETRVVALMKGHWSEAQQSHLVVQLLLLSHCIIFMSLLVFSFGLSPFRSSLHSFLTHRYLAPFLNIVVPPPKQLFIL
ncbi:MAG: hypothetical protein ACO1NX_00620 [Chitinophagaceae bacterium]